MANINKSKVNRILVITLSNIGDIILTTPVVETLLREFPGVRLDVMVGPNGKDLFGPHKGIGEIIIYDKRSSSLDKFKLFIMLRKKRYNLVADLRNTILPLVLGARFNTSAIRRDSKNGMHRKDVHLSRLRDLSIDTSRGKFYIPVREKDKERVGALLGELKERPYVVVSPGAKSHVKRWPLKHFAKLCDMIKIKLRVDVVLIGDESDRVVIERILFNAETKPLNLIDKTNIGELAYMIKRSKLLITNDSAPLHVGSAVNAPTVVFFGPTDDRKYGPLTESGSRVLKKKLKCSPCEVPQCINYDNKYECLKTITVEEAFEAVKELLDSAT
ncbi:MAG: glycosyltransferase family 9 protein [Candidatus Omnitrophota bacterium]